MKTKAYKLIVEDLSEPWHWDDVIVYADTAGEAKSKGLSEFSGAEVRDIFEINNWRDVKYTDIKAFRLKEMDKVMHNGNLITKTELDQAKWQEERDSKALEFTKTHPNSLFVIWAGCYCQYWGANRSGYATDIKYAGKYTPQEAYDIISGNDYSRQEVVKLLDIVEYNEKIDKEVERLLSAKL